MIGPVEFMVIRFEGNKLSGKILPELQAVRSAKIVRLLDMVVVQKSESGDVAVAELSDLSDTELEKLRPEEESLGWFAQEDINSVANQLPNNSTAALLLFEHTWAAKISEAVRLAGGEVLADERITRLLQSKVSKMTLTRRHPRIAAN
jgi:uncharacterized membrane protein